MKPNESVGVAMSKTEIAKLLLEIQANDAIRNHEPYVKALALAAPAVLFPAPDLEVTAQAGDRGDIRTIRPGAPTVPSESREPIYIGGARPEQIRCMPERLYPMDPPPPESLLERRAWKLLLAMSYALTSEEDDGKREAIGRAFDLAEMFAAEAAKRRTGGV